MLPKSDVRRRIRAAMALADIQSVEDLAERINQPRLGARTLRKIADPKDPRPTGMHEYEAIARVTGVPVEFFTSNELFPPAAEDRTIEAFRDVLAGHDQHMTALYADIVRRMDQLKGMLTGLREAGSAPAPGGELGRRLGEHQTRSQDPDEHGSRPGTGARQGNER